MNLKGAGFRQMEQGVKGRAASVGSCVLSMALLLGGVILSGCGKVEQTAHDAVVQKVNAATKPVEPATPSTKHVQEAKPVGQVPTPKPAPSPETLVGQTTEAVVALLGKPQGMFETGKGATWMYSRWRVQFDDHQRVSSVERDVSSTSTGAAIQFPPHRPKVQVRAVEPAEPPTTSDLPLTVISNGGQSVDLNTLLADDSVTIVDFYADWCGPCRALSPRLEKLVKASPNVVLVKVDIVRWGTPVTKQFGIRSVPNVRVFNRNKVMVGKPTHDLSLVAEYVDQASR